MKLLKSVVLSFLFVGNIAVAQAPTPVDAEQKAAVKELLDAMNFKQVMSQMGSMMGSQMPAMFDQMFEKAPGASQMSPEEKAEARLAAQKSSSRTFAQMNEMYSDPLFIQGVEDIMARAYARNFTVAEIRATTAFYTSPAGSKALTLMPKIMQETMPEMMAMMSPRITAVMESVTKDVVAQVEAKRKAKADATK